MRWKTGDIPVLYHLCLTAIALIDWSHQFFGHMNENGLIFDIILWSANKLLLCYALAYCILGRQATNLP